MKGRKSLRGVASIGHGARLPGGRPLDKTAARVGGEVDVDVGTSIADVHDSTLVVLNGRRLHRVVIHCGEQDEDEGGRLSKVRATYLVVLKRVSLEFASRVSSGRASRMNESTWKNDDGG